MVLVVIAWTMVVPFCRQALLIARLIRVLGLAASVAVVAGSGAAVVAAPMTIRSASVMKETMTVAAD